MNTNATMALISVFALCLPVLILFITRLSNYKSFPVLCSYFMLMIFDNCVGEGYINVPKQFSHYSAVINNLLDPLLMLGFLIYFSHTSLVKKRILKHIVTLVVFDIFIVSIFGFNDNALAIALGPGLGSVAVLCIFFFQHQVKLSVIKGKAIGKAVIISALTFMYGSYFISYLMYFVFKNHDLDSSYLILYSINIISSITLAIGIAIEKQRVKKLQEILTARKEMAEIYASVSYQAPKPNVFTIFRKKSTHLN